MVRTFSVQHIMGETQIRAKVFELEAKKRKYGYNNGKRPANKI